MRKHFSPAFRARLAPVGLLMALTAFAWARSPAYNQGDAAYQRNDFSTAAAKFRQATQDDPKDALGFWKLGLALRKTGDNAGAVSAWDQARAIDPSLAFASSPQKFHDLYDKTARKAGNGSAGRVPTQSTRNPVGDIIVPALEKDDVYIDAPMKSVADKSKLQRLARSYKPNVVKIAIMTGAPGDRDQFAEFLSGYLGLHRGLMIVATQTGAGAFTAALDRQQIKEMVKASVPSFKTSYYDGAKFIADRTFGAPAGQPLSGVAPQHGGSSLLWIVIIAALGVAAIAFFRRSAEKKHIQTLNRDIGARLQAVDEEFARFDREAAGATDSPLLQEARQIRSAAVDPFAAAGEAFNTAATVKEYLDVDRMTTQAEKLTARARVRLDQALGKRSLDDAAGSAASIPSAEQVPQDDRGACFFCSKPARLETLHPLQINVDGQVQRVLACDDCYEVARTGRKPQILAVPDEYGRREPWYQSRRYDPWRDYGRGGLFGGNGFGLMDYLMLENLFDHDRRSNTTVILPQDPGYSERFARDAGGAGFSDPNTWLQPERGEGDFFGSGFDAADGGDRESGEGDFFGGDNS
jgi:hypothetical protein